MISLGQPSDLNPPALKHCAYCHAIISGEDTYCSSACQEADVYE